MNEAQTYSLMLFEPSEIVAAGIRKILGGSEFRTVGNGSDDFDRAVGDIARSQPDMVVVNPSLLSDTARRMTLRAVYPQLHDVALVALVYTLFDEAQMNGFDAVISIFDPPQQVVRKLRKALETVGAGTAQTQNEGYELSEREREILVSVARGLTNKEIADRHNISIHTVISHRKNISRKTGIKTIAGLTVYALLNNMISEADI